MFNWFFSSVLCALYINYHIFLLKWIAICLAFTPLSSLFIAKICIFYFILSYFLSHSLVFLFIADSCYFFLVFDPFRHWWWFWFWWYFWFIFLVVCIFCLIDLINFIYSWFFEYIDFLILTILCFGCSILKQLPFIFWQNIKNIDGEACWMRVSWMRWAELLPQANLWETYPFY